MNKLFPLLALLLVLASVLFGCGTAGQTNADANARTAGTHPHSGARVVHLS